MGRYHLYRVPYDVNAAGIVRERLGGKAAYESHASLPNDEMAARKLHLVQPLALSLRLLCRITQVATTQPRLANPQWSYWLSAWLVD